MTIRRMIMSVAIGGVAIAAFGAVQAHEGATGVVKERMELMKSMGKASKTLSAMFKGEQPYEAATVRELSRQVKDEADKVPQLFPEGSANPPSEAKPEIWSEWERFQKITTELAAASGKLSDAADDRSAALKAFMEVGNSCRSCHERFREEDD